MSDGSIFKFDEIKNNAELTGSDITSKKAGKRPDISSASKESVSHPDSKVNILDKESSSRAKVTPEPDASYHFA